jgi:hypothetical protein
MGFIRTSPRPYSEHRASVIVKKALG